MGKLAVLEQELEAADVAECDAARLRELVGTVVAGERILAGHKARIAAAAAALERTGSGPAAPDVLSGGGAVSARAAKAAAAQAKLHERFPGVAAKACAGAAYPENVETLTNATRSLNAAELTELAGHDAALASGVEHDRPDLFAARLRDRIRVVREQCRRTDDADTESLAQRQRAASGFTMGTGRDGMWWLRGELDPERARVLNDLINQHAKAFAANRSATANDRAAALVELTGNTSGGDGGPVPKMGIGIISDAATAHHGPHPHSVAQDWDGGDIDPVTVTRLACDADHYTVWINPDGHPEAAAQTARAATRAQRLALRALYPTCPLDNTTPFARCEIHHVNIAHVAGGFTTLDNLVPISSEWHHRIHDNGWTLTMDPDRTLHLHRPDSTPDRTVAPPTPITRHGP